LTRKETAPARVPLTSVTVRMDDINLEYAAQWERSRTAKEGVLNPKTGPRKGAVPTPETPCGKSIFPFK